MMHNQKTDSERARDAFDQLRPHLDQLGELRRANVDVEKAAAHAVVIGRMVKEPTIYELFAKLPREAFDIRHVDNLELAALATLHAVLEHRDAAVHGSQAQVPADLAAEATELRDTMLRVVNYHLRDDHVVAVITDIEAGQGHADRASDLMRLAKLYDTHEPRLAQDRTYYQRADADRARELAHRIYQHIGGDGESQERTWASYVQRAWTFLLNTYNEVCTTGRWLYRHDNGLERFPSLIAAQRQTAKRGSHPADTDADAEADILALPETAADAATDAATDATTDATTDVTGEATPEAGGETS